MSEDKKLDNLFEVIENARKLERQAIGEKLLDLYDTTPRGERISLFEKIIEQLVRGERPE